MGHCPPLAWDIRTAYELVGPPGWTRLPNRSTMWSPRSTARSPKHEIRAMLRTLLAATIPACARRETRDLPSLSR